MENRVSYIFVGSSGMGLATARTLVEEGRNVVLFDHDNVRLEEAKTSLDRVRKGHTETRHINIHDFDCVDAVVEEIDQEVRHIDQFINSAGVFAPNSSRDSCKGDYETYLEMNRSTFFLTQAITRNMNKNGGGTILNVGSMWAQKEA